MLYDTHGHVPEEPYVIPFGDAKITREGDDVTIVAFGRMVCLANDVADKLSGEISVEVVDPRTTSPLDTETILESVRHTGRLVVVDEANPICSMASEVISVVATEGLGCSLHHRLKSPHRTHRSLLRPTLSSFTFLQQKRSNRQSERPVHDPRFRSWSLD